MFLFYMKKAGNGLIFLLAILLGCSGVSKRPMEGAFNDVAYHYLVNEFTEKGLHNLDSPLFDFDDLEVRNAYDKVTEGSRAKVISRDITGNKNIRGSVLRHLERYGDRSLIIISGAAFHIHGAISYLENNFNAEYISITPRKLNFNDVLEFGKIFTFNSNQEKIQNAKESLEIQLQRGSEVIKNYGSRNLKSFISEISDFDDAANLVVGIEETGMHSLYAEEDFKPVYDVLSKFVETYNPESILYLREGPSSPKSAKNFLKKSKRLGIPVVSNAFLSIMD